MGFSETSDLKEEGLRKTNEQGILSKKRGLDSFQIFLFP